MRKLFFSIGLVLIGFALFAQSMDCPSTLKSRKATPPYAINVYSKSMQCSTDKNYEYDVILNPGKEYRITFYASSIFNNRMSFQIIDTKTGMKLMDLPGETQENLKGESVLREYYDYKNEKMVYPCFDFCPEEILNLKIAINIPEYKYKVKTVTGDPDFGTEDKFEEIIEKRKGCVTIFIQEMASDEIGYEK